MGKEKPSNETPHQEPFDEVERIEPRQWPENSETFPTKSTRNIDVSHTSQRLPHYPTTLAQRSPTTQRYKK